MREDIYISSKYMDLNKVNNYTFRFTSSIPSVADRFVNPGYVMYQLLYQELPPSWNVVKATNESIIWEDPNVVNKKLGFPPMYEAYKRGDDEQTLPIKFVENNFTDIVWIDKNPRDIIFKGKIKC